MMGLSTANQVPSTNESVESLQDSKAVIVAMFVTRYRERFFLLGGAVLIFGIVIETHILCS